MIRPWDGENCRRRAAGPEGDAQVAGRRTTFGSADVGDALRGCPNRVILLAVRVVKPFSLLSQVYDAIMDDVDYEDWADFILETVTSRGWQPGDLLDLGCGTGNATFPMVARGLSVTGLDASAEMLAVARAKVPNVAFVQADFADFALPTRFSLVYSVFDSLNNLLRADDFASMARSVYAHLQPGGFFMFDVNTTAGLRDLWEAGRAEGWAGDVYYRWEHSYDEATGLAKVEAYCETETTSFTEVHLERGYDLPELRVLLAEAGFVNIEGLSYPDSAPAWPDDPRLWVVACKR